MSALVKELKVKYSIGSNGLFYRILDKLGIEYYTKEEYEEKYKLPAMMKKFTEIKQIFDSKRGEGKISRKNEGKANRAMIAKLRESGMSYQEISELTGMSYQTLANGYSKYKKERMEND